MVRWEPYLFAPTPPATAEQIAAVARTWGVAALPPDFLDVATRHQGESPDPGAVRVSGQPRTVECLLHFREDPASWSLSVVDTELRDRLPVGVHPVAASTSGTFFALDLRGVVPGDPAPVVHVDLDVDPEDDPDEALRVVAPSTADFLSRLHDGAEHPGPGH